MITSNDDFNGDVVSTSLLSAACQNPGQVAELQIDALEGFLFLAIRYSTGICLDKERVRVLKDRCEEYLNT